MYHLLRMTCLLLKCLFATVFNCLSSLVYVLKLILSFFSFLSYSQSYLNGVSEVGSLFPLSSLTVTYILYSSPLCVALLFMFPFPCVGSRRDKSLRFARNHLLYLLNAADLTLLNSLLARTEHTGLQATCEHRQEEKELQRRWPGQGQSVTVPSVRDKSGILG